MSKQFPSGSQSAYNDYVQALSDAINNRDWVYDPSYALQTDADIYAKILRDPIAAHAIRFRKHMVAGSKVRVVPASERPTDEAAAKVCEELLAQISGFTDARICLAEAIFQGSAYAMVTGKRRNMIAGSLPGIPDADPIPLDWWVPERIADIDRRRFRRAKSKKTGALEWQLWSVERREWEALTRPEWFIRSVHEGTEATLGHGRGLLDTLYFYQAAKARAFQDLMAAGERFGQGLVTVGIENLRGQDGRPVGGAVSKQSVAAAWQSAIAKAKARHVITHDARDEINVINGIGEGWQLLQWIVTYIDNAQVTAILGSTLPTLEGDGGSRALGEVQENSTEVLVQADRQRQSDDLERDLLGLIWRHNRAQIFAQIGSCNMPHLAIDQRKREDPEAQAELISKLLAAGVPLRAKEVYEKTGFTQPLPGDDVLGGGAASGAGDDMAVAGMGGPLPAAPPPAAPQAPLAPPPPEQPPVFSVQPTQPGVSLPVPSILSFT